MLLSGNYDNDSERCGDIKMSELKELIEILSRNNLSNNTLWDMDDLAEFMRLSKSSVQSRVINQRHFPRVISIPLSTGKQSNRRWLPKEVKEWALKHRVPVS